MQTTAMLDVNDVEASSRWYQALLGFRSGHGGPDFEMLMFGETLQLMLHRGDASHHPDGARGGPRGAGVCLYIRVDDLAAVDAKATKMGVVHEPIKRNELAHQDEIELRDPDGYFITVCGPAEWA